MQFALFATDMTVPKCTCIVFQVKISLSASGKCVKKFRPMVQPGTINTISFAFKTRQPRTNMTFVYIQNQEMNEPDTEKVHTTS